MMFNQNSWRMPFLVQCVHLYSAFSLLQLRIRLKGKLIFKFGRKTFIDGLMFFR